MDFTQAEADLLIDALLFLRERALPERIERINDLIDKITGAPKNED